MAKPQKEIIIDENHQTILKQVKNTISNLEKKKVEKLSIEQRFNQLDEVIEKLKKLNQETKKTVEIKKNLENRSSICLEQIKQRKEFKELIRNLEKSYLNIHFEDLAKY